MRRVISVFSSFVQRTGQKVAVSASINSRISCKVGAGSGGTRTLRSFSCGTAQPNISNKQESGNTPGEGSLNYYSQSREALVALLESIGEPAFREKQIRKWVFDHGVTDINAMKDLPVSCRENLASKLHFGTLSVLTERVSKDGTRKRAYSLRDGQIIESVLMPYKDGRITACISSQAGCAMKCVFCATGQMGFSRQMSAAEVFEQVAKFSGELRAEGKRLSNVVFMGMGEPLLNFENVLAACHMMHKELGISMRNITISTVGIAPRIKKLADTNSQINLAISLHQATNEKRGKLMPINNKYSIEELIEACKYYIEKTNRRISFEWALIDGETDTLEAAEELGKLLNGILCHVNVIPLNPTKGFSGKASSKESVNRFVECLQGKYGIPATIRIRRGIDIDAGCGQLKADLLKRRPPVRSAATTPSPSPSPSTSPSTSAAASNEIDPSVLPPRSESA